MLSLEKQWLEASGDAMVNDRKFIHQLLHNFNLHEAECLS